MTKLTSVWTVAILAIAVGTASASDGLLKGLRGPLFGSKTTVGRSVATTPVSVRSDSGGPVLTRLQVPPAPGVQGAYAAPMPEPLPGPVDFDTHYGPADIHGHYGSLEGGGPGLIHGPIGPAVELFPCVKYRGLHRMSPCSVPKLVQIRNPHACRKACGCCVPPCVNVLICVPTCGCETVKVKRNGDRIVYDYGKYWVVVQVRKNDVLVNYHRRLLF
jgi:hypothetical protein